MSQRHYEIVFLIHPDRTDQVSDIIKNYEAMIADGKGTVHRLENWGTRSLAYPIKKLSRATYVLMNIECDDKTLQKIEYNFRFNENIIRNLILKRDLAETAPSLIMTQPKLEKNIESAITQDAPLAHEAQVNSEEK